MKDIDRLHLVALIAENLPESFVSAETIAAVFGGDADTSEDLLKKQLDLAKHLAGEKEKESDEKPRTVLLSIMARLEGAKKENRDKFGYLPTVLNPKEPDCIIPTQLDNAPATDVTELWECFAKDFQKLNGTPPDAVYQTVFALLRKYTARIQAFPEEPDVSLYDFLRTTAAIAACIAREKLSEGDIDAHLRDKNPQRELCLLLKGDISGIQSFLYQILSDGAARQLRGRSFYLQLLTEAIAHWVLRKLELPIANLLLATGGHFYLLAPYTEANEALEDWRREISEKLWTLHQGDLSFLLAGTPITVGDFKPEKFSDKWDDVSKKVNRGKDKKWAELGDTMFSQLFEPFTQRYEPVSADADEAEKDPWEFRELGGKLRDATYLIVSETEEGTNDDEHNNWETSMKAFGWKIHFPDSKEDPPDVSEADRAIVYRIGDTDFLENIPTFTCENTPVSYDFRLFPQVIAYRHDKKAEAVADYNYLADASDGVHWLGALRMDVDDLGTIFKGSLGNNATISRMATLSESLRLFFEGYVPALCQDYNGKRSREILELIYAGGDDLFLVGGWSALPEIAQKIRDEFRGFVTADHVTLSGGIFIEHQKFPLHQFADRSGDAESAAKNLQREDSSKEKDAISFLQTPMAWDDFTKVSEWQQKFVNVVTTKNDSLPRDMLTRLSQIYSDKELEDTRWAWRSLYYFHRMKERYKKENHRQFLRNLERKLSETDASFELKKFIRVVTRWAALRTRETNQN